MKHQLTEANFSKSMSTNSLEGRSKTKLESSLSRSAIIFVNFRFDLDDGVDEEADDARLGGCDGVVHAGNLVAGVVLDPTNQNQDS